MSKLLSYSVKNHPKDQGQNWLNVSCWYYLSDADILLLRIDVEGFEADVLRGASKTLPRIWFIILDIEHP